MKEVAFDSRFFSRLTAGWPIIVLAPMSRYLYLDVLVKSGNGVVRNTRAAKLQNPR